MPTSFHAGRPSVVLSRPTSTNVSGGTLVVSGRLDHPAETVVVSLRTRREHLIDSAQVPATPDGLAFEASLTARGPAAGGDPRRLWLEVIGYGADGVPVAGTVVVLRVHGPRLLGEDRLGILGAPLPPATPQPPQYWPVGELSWQVNPAQL